MIKKLFILLFSIMAFMRVLNSEEIPKIYIDNITATSNEEILVNVNLINNKGLSYISFIVNYPLESLEYISSEVNIDGDLKGSEINLDNHLAFYSLSINNLINNNGTILKIKFKVKDNIKEDIVILIEEVSAGIEENEEQVNTENGLIHIIDSENVKKDENISLIDEIKNKDLENITWESSDESVAVVDKNGNVTFLKDGIVTIKAKNNNEILLEKKYKIESTNNNIIFLIIVIALIIIVTSIIKVRKNK